MSIHCLYRMRSDNGQLLYVGMTLNPHIRLESHRKNKEWWSDVATIRLQHFESSEEVAAAEREAIRTEHPLYNAIRFGAKGGLPPRKTAKTAVAVNGPLIREVRLRTGYSIAGTAAALGCHRSYITKLETGSSRQVSVEFYHRLLEHLAIQDHRTLLAAPFAVAS
jgi:predicted GIY-YIG superfamily endonuclease